MSQAVDNICQSETFHPPHVPSVFRINVKRDVHLLKQRNLNQHLKGPLRIFQWVPDVWPLMYKCLHHGKIFPGVCSFIHCCTTGIIKLFPWRKAILNQRHAHDKIIRLTSTMAETKNHPSIPAMLHVGSELDKNLAGPDALKLMHSAGSTVCIYRWGAGTRHPSARCSSTRALISNSEAILTREANLTLIYNVFHTSDLVTWIMTYTIFRA